MQWASWFCQIYSCFNQLVALFFAQSKIFYESSNTGLVCICLQYISSRWNVDSYNQTVVVRVKVLAALLLKIQVFRMWSCVRCVVPHVLKALHSFKTSETTHQWHSVKSHKTRICTTIVSWKVIYEDAITLWIFHTASKWVHHHFYVSTLVLSTSNQHTLYTVDCVFKRNRHVSAKYEDRIMVMQNNYIIKTK